MEQLNVLALIASFGFLIISSCAFTIPKLYHFSSAADTHDTRNSWSAQHNIINSPTAPNNILPSKFRVHTQLFAQHTTLHFAGKETFQSESVPLKSFANLETFFQLHEVQRMLLSGNGDGDEPPKGLSKSESMSYKKQWTKKARIVGALDPDPGSGDIAYRVNTGGINFAGLKVTSEAIIGVKLLNRKSDGFNLALPEYELVFIQDQRTAKGPKFLVWIFNRLTGQNSKADESEEAVEKEQSVTSMSRFYVKVTQDDNGKSMVTFAIDSYLDIAVKFPSLLLKILPVTKEKAEEQGSASVKKTIMSDTRASVKRIAHFYSS